MIIGVDKENPLLPQELLGKTAILLNVTRAKVLLSYADQLWKELVIINEVYPEPSADEVKKFSSIGCKLYHIAGIPAFTFPPLSGAYKGYMPCCAAIMENDEVVNVGLKKLN